MELSKLEKLRGLIRASHRVAVEVDARKLRCTASIRAYLVRAEYHLAGIIKRLRKSNVAE